MANSTESPRQLSLDFPQTHIVYIPPTKAEIARVYEFSPKTLQRIIAEHLDKFLAIGYNVRRKILTPKERELLRELIGNPYPKQP